MKIYTKYFINNIWQMDYKGYELGYDNVAEVSVWLCTKADGTQRLVTIDVDTHEILEDVPYDENDDGDSDEEVESE
jgi:hypothetical protein